MSVAQSLYVGRNDTNILYKANDTTVNTDAGTTYQAYIKTKSIDVSGLTKEFGLGKGFLLAKKNTDTALKIDVTVTRNFGEETRTFTEDLTGDTSATRVVKTFEVDMADAGFVDIQIGDTAAVNKDWQLDAFEVLVTEQGTK